MDRPKFYGHRDMLDVRAILSRSNIGGPSWGPRGIVFSMAADGTGQLYSIQPDGTGLTQLAAGFDDSGPAWSPDGTELAFTRQGDGGNSVEVYIVGVDGAGLRQLTEGPSWRFRPVEVSVHGTSVHSEHSAAVRRGQLPLSGRC